MTIGWAIFLSTVLFILYKTEVLTSRIFWRRTAKTGIVLAVLAVLTIGGFYGWDRYDDWRQQRAALASPNTVEGQLTPAPKITLDGQAQTAEEAEEDCVQRMKMLSPKWSNWDERAANSICIKNPNESAVNLDDPSITVDLNTGEISERGSYEPPPHMTGTVSVEKNWPPHTHKDGK